MPLEPFHICHILLRFHDKVEIFIDKVVKVVHC